MLVPMKKAKGIILFSGGLDSLLAAKILLNQQIELIGINCVLPYVSPFIKNEELAVSKFADEINLKLIYHRCGKPYIEMLKKPRYGYGKNINPCIDCKIFFLKVAEKYMKELSADFVATGEVVGQRPMSQLKHTLLQIENNSSLKGRLLRPLSAKILEPTVPEKEGLIDRNKFYEINGRSRTAQFKLAEELNIIEYESPAGGCKFTDKNISNRMFDIIKHKNEIDDIDLYLCTIGRHFRLNENLKIIVARNSEECNKLEEAIKYSNGLFIPNFSGPSVYIDGKIDCNIIEIIVSIINKFGKYCEKDNSIDLYNNKYKIIRTVSSKTIVDTVFLESKRI